MLDRTPHVFISYSWTSDEFKTRIKELAERLTSDGVMVEIDIWDLKEGQDKYAFMEQCVTESEIDKVLIICNRSYAEKANKRQGGVGDETVIISPELYKSATQEKFIPVIMEHDEEGKPFLPSYLKSRIYVDLSGDNYENGYDELLRNIYKQPLHRRPELGKPPVWLDKETPSKLLTVKQAVWKTGTSNVTSQRVKAHQDFVDVYLDAMKQFYNEQVNEEQYLDNFKAMKEYRNAFLDWLQLTSQNEVQLGTFLADVFEKLYNSLYCAKFFIPGAMQAGEDEYDIFRLHIWELFICTVTYLLHYDKFSEIHDLLVHTYFLRTNMLGDSEDAVSYAGFRFYSKVIEEHIKPKLELLNNRYTLAGYFLCKEREYMPIYSGKAMANADLFLYQVYNGLGLGELAKGDYWFPKCYVYADIQNSKWQRLKSKKFCEKIMPLFGVNNIEDLKSRLSLCMPNNRVTYNEYYYAPAILSFLKIEEIAVLP